jgi:hypothetical protein
LPVSRAELARVLRLWVSARVPHPLSADELTGG